MFGLSAERPMFSWLLSRLGPPPPPPRRYFSKSWDRDAQYRAIARPGKLGKLGKSGRLGSLGRGTENYAVSADEVFADSPDAPGSNGPSGTR